jgi:hypothetical protein
MGRPCHALRQHSPDRDLLLREFRHHGRWQATAFGWAQVSQRHLPRAYRKSWPCLSLGVGEPPVHDIAQDRRVLPVEDLGQRLELGMRISVEAGWSSDAITRLLRGVLRCHRHCW